MKYDTLGNTGLKVSKICLGTMTFGQQNTEEEGHAQLDYALDQGVNFIDTAEMYPVPGREATQGSTERIIGTWIKSRAKREKFILATKVTGPSGMTWIRNPLKFNREQIEQAIDGSLKRLQTDYVDLYQLHWPERKTNYFGKLGYQHDENDRWEDNFQSVLEVLRDLIKAGKIRHFGLSNETPWGLMRVFHLSEVHDLPRCVSVQNPYSLLNRAYEVGMAEASIRENAGLLAYSPLGFGVLSGKYLQEKTDPKWRINQFPAYSRYSNPICQKATRQYLEIAQKYGLSLTHLALAFVNTRPFLTSNIIGATNLDQLKENISSIEVKLTPEIIKEIDAVHNEISNPAP